MIRFIFAIYILFLSVSPCNDQEIHADEQNSETGISITNANHNHNDDAEDACTPFCICSCCAASIQLTHITSISFAPPIHNTAVNTAYFEKPLLSNIKSIWQPPRLV
jgi:hypothetical protein